MKKCVFAGTFDPPTVGHEDVVNACARMFDKVYVAVLDNPQKSTLLSAEQRAQLLKKLFGGNPSVEVLTFTGAAVDLLDRLDTPFYVRGVRDAIDFEYENRNHYASKRLKPDLVTIYIPSEQRNLHVSSTLVRNSLKFRKDYDDLIPSAILADVKAMLEAKDV